MNESLCPRCHAALPSAEDGTLRFCPSCGAPQIRLSAELAELAEAQLAGGETASAAAITAEGAVAPPPMTVAWRTAIRLALLVAGTTALLSFVFPPLMFLAWLSPFAVVSLYATRMANSRVSAATGARLGFLSGVFTAAGIALLMTLQMLVLRFGLHRMGEFNAQVDATMLTMRANAAPETAAASESFFRLFAIPEFRAGFFLGGLGMLVLALVVLSTLFGAVAGWMRTAARTAERPR